MTTGGSSGIGEATVRFLSQQRASVVFGDVDSAKGAALAAELGDQVHFLRTDVTQYDECLALFKCAHEKYGRVDMAISNAAIMERGSVFSEKLDPTSVLETPDLSVLDINLKGAIHFARIAIVYLKIGAGVDEDKSIIFLASLASFHDTPGFFVYQTAKHGVLGLMRSLRFFASTKLGIRVNCVCPWATDTPMIAGAVDSWVSMGHPMNTAIDVAKIVVALGVDKTINGKNVFVEGGNGWEIEQKLTDSEPQIYGCEVADRLRKGQEFLLGSVGFI
jgi:NAD(P)-dependent dehydrogenase (short-subunit alcohol dehydrogenase family)